MSPAKTFFLCGLLLLLVITSLFLLGGLTARRVQYQPAERFCRRSA